MTSASLVQARLRVTEGTESVWRYHLARPKEFRALCGRLVMDTAIPVEQWGRPSLRDHIPESWCSICGDAVGAQPKEA